MRSVNKTILIGNVGSEPDVRTTMSGTSVAKLSLATNEKFRDRTGADQEKTQWHRLTFFGKLVDVVEQWVARDLGKIGNKGDRLYIEGKIEYSTTEDEAGNTRYWTDIIVREMVMLSGNEQRQSSPGGYGPQPQARGPRPPMPEDPEDDLPF